MSPPSIHQSGFASCAKEERYELCEPIGEGATGKVFRAVDRVLNRTVAVKVLHGEMASNLRYIMQLKREVTLASRVQDPHVVRVHDLGEVDGQPLIAMDWVEGENLATLLFREHCLPPSQVCNLASQICQALVAIHSASIIHRDLKPGNLLITKQGAILVSDFGLACSLAGDLTLSTSGEKCGTPRYMAPEQVAGLPADARSDLYSLGLVLLEMLTGTTSLETLDQLRMRMVLSEGEKRVRSGELRKLSVLDRVVRHCLQLDRSQRYDSAADVLRDLTEQNEVPSVPLVAAPFWRSVGRSLSELTRKWSLRKQPAFCKAEKRITSGESTGNQLNSESNYVRRSSTSGSFPTPLLVTFSLASVITAVLILYRFFAPADQGYVHIEHAIAMLPFDMKEVPASTEAILRSLESNLYRRFAEAVPDAKVWHSDRTSPVNPKSMLLEKAAIVIDGQFVYENGRLRAKVAIHELLGRRRTSTIYVDGTSRDFLQFENQLLTVLLSDRYIHNTAGRVRKTQEITINADSYRAFCQAKNLIRLGASLSELQQAMVLLDEATARDPNFAIGYATKADLDLQAYQLNRAPKLLADAWIASERGAHLDPNAVPVKVAMAYTYLAANQADHAVRLLDDDSLLHSDTIQRVLGVVLLEGGAARQALKAIQRSVALNPLSSSSYLALGDCYEELADYAGAIGAYRNALDLDKNDETALNNLGEACIRIGRFEEAIPVLQTALRFRPDAVTYANLGFAYLYSDQAALAVPLFEKAAVLDHSTDEYLGALAEVYDLLGDIRSKAILERARSIAVRRTELDHDNGALLSRLALYDARLGRPVSAEKEIRAAVRAAPTDLDVRYNLALVQLLGNEMVDARKTLQSLGEAGSDSPFRPDNPDRKLLESLPDFAALRARYAHK